MISKKIILLALLIIFTTASEQFLFAQDISNYSFTTSAPGYTALATPTFPPISSGDNDDGYFNNIPIGFDFWYMGIRYTSISASTNGWITLGSNISDPTFSNDLTNGGAPRPVIAPLWDDLDIQSITNVSYITSGVAGSQVFTVQFQKAKWDYNGPACMSFQVNLYESSGKIDFTYKQVGTTVPNSPSASIGLTYSYTGSGNFLSVNDAGTSVSTTVESSIVSRPADGIRYSFTPPVPAAPSALTFSNIGSSTMTLNWMDNSNNESGFVVYRSDDGGATYNFSRQTVNSNTMSLNVYGLSPTTNYFWKVCAVSEGGLSSPVTGNQTTICDGPVISQVPTAGLISYYRMDGNPDDIQNNNHLQPRNGPTLSTDRFGNANSAYTLSSSAFQSIATSTIYNNPTTNTISIWFKTTQAGGKLFGFGNSQYFYSTHYDRHIYMNDKGQLLFGVFSGTINTIKSTLSYNDGKWHMATASYGPTNGIRLFVDGNLIASNSSVTGGENFSGYWKLGFDNVNSWPEAPADAFFNGALDEAYIYDRELLASEVLVLYSSPLGAGSDAPVCDGSTLNLSSTTIAATTYSWTGPNSFASASQNPSVTNMSVTNVGTYTLNATVGGCATISTAYALGKINNDLSLIMQVPSSGIIAYYKLDSNASDETMTNHGALQNNPTLTSDRFGNANKAYTLNGTSQFISSSVPYTNPNDFTLSLWFNTTTTNGGKLIGFGSDQIIGSSNFDRHIWMTDNGKIYFGINSSGTAKVISSTNSYNDGNWHFVTASMSSSNGIKLYVDGSLLSSNASSLSAQNFTGYWRIGYDNINWLPAPLSAYFGGSIDDVLIYNREITSTEVTTLYISANGAGTNFPICPGSTLGLTATTLGGASYSWTGPNSFTSATQNPSILNLSSANEGTYTLTVTSAGCNATAYALLRPLKTAPSAPATTDSNRCGTGTVSLNASGSISYNWYDAGSAGTLLNSGSAFTTPSISTSTTYYAASFDGTCESITRTPAIATIYTIPAAPSGTDGSRCGTGTIDLNANGAVNYNWYDASSTGTLLGSGSTFTTPSISGTVIYYASAISVDNCESTARTAVTATINTIPSAPVGTDGSRCGTGTVDLNANGAANYNWYDASSAGTLVGSGATFTTPSVSGTVVYFASAISVDNCESTARTAVTATIHTIPAAPSSTDGSRCGTGTVDLNANGAVNYNWYDASSAGTLLGSGATFTTPAISTNTTYYASAISAANCESTGRTSVLAIIIYPVSDPGTLSGDTAFFEIVNSGQIDLVNYVGSIIRWEYSTNDFISYSNSNNTLSNYIYKDLKQTTSFRAIVKAGTCPEAASNIVKITINFDDFKIYSSFSPNNDGINDVWYIDGIGKYPDNKVLIFDRWGDVIFEEKGYDNFNKVWRGEAKSGILPDGTYFYQVDLGNGSTPHKGFVVLKKQ